ncbi:MAG: glycosyltransferase [Trueperaceae bacterium]
MPESSRVCVVTVTYGNRFDFLARMVEATVAEGVGRVLIVDNASEPESGNQIDELVQSAEGRIVALRLPENGGSAGGYKAGLEYAAEADYDYFWLLDDDNCPEPGALAQLLGACTRYEGDTAFLSLRTDRQQYIAYAKGCSKEACFGRRNSFLGFALADIPSKVLRRVLGKQLDSTIKPTEKLRPVPVAPYGGLFFPKRLLHKVGLPRHDFYLYGDDHEFTHRFIQNGVPIFLVPASRVTDIDRSWHVKADDQRDYFIHPLVLTAARTDKSMRLYYSVRNRVYLERTALVAQPLLHFCNALSYLSMLGLLSLVAAVLKTTLAPLSNFGIIMRAVSDAGHNRLGKKALQ